MAKQLNILFVSSEVDPFAKTGGLADVCSALPHMVKEMGQEVRVMMPRYGSISDRKFMIHNVIRLKEIPIPVGKEEKLTSINSSFIATIKTKVQVYFLSNKEYFNRDGLYASNKTHVDFKDNDERFIFFCRGVLETLKRLGWQPDIIHCNDWQTGLIPAYMKTIYANDPFYKNIKTIFTIHNLAYQGNFPESTLAKTGLPKELYNDDGVKFKNQFSFIKAGIAFADMVTTVSDQYAKEISSSKEFGYGFEEFIKKKKINLTGILNGINYNVWNPEIDPLISKRFNSKSIEGKLGNKIEVLERFGLESNYNVPLFGMISRLVPLKGIELIEKIADKFLKHDVRFVILGSGEKNINQFLKNCKRNIKTKLDL